jgi:Arc/MetJ-type ribon-helix-helix transcriptional regulator
MRCILRPPTRFTSVTLKKGKPEIQIEILTLALERRVRRQIESGQFHNVDDLLNRALDALEEKNTAPGSVERDATGAALLAVLQDSPYPEIDLAPPRERVPVEVRDIVL